MGSLDEREENTVILSTSEGLKTFPSQVQKIQFGDIGLMMLIDQFLVIFLRCEILSKLMLIKINCSSSTILKVETNIFPRIRLFKYFVVMNLYTFD